MILNVAKRITILKMLSFMKGSYEEMSFCYDITKKIELDLDLITKIDFKINQNGIPVWDSEEEGEPLIVEFYSDEIAMLKKCIDDFSNAKQLTLEVFELCKEIKNM